MTGVPAGYGFVEFSSHETAERVLNTWNGVLIPNGSGRTYRLSWATYSAKNERGNNANEWDLYVGDLNSDVGDQMLANLFREKYPSVVGARLVIDLQTKVSKGYGFVKFSDEGERNDALQTMAGTIFSGRPIKVSLPTQDTQNTQMSARMGYTTPEQQADSCTLYISGLDPNTDNDAQLHKLLSDFGELVYCKITFNKTTCYAQFTNRMFAERAQKTLNDTYLGTQKLKVMFKVVKSTPNNFANPMLGGMGMTAMYDPNAMYQQAYGYPQMYPMMYGAQGYPATTGYMLPGQYPGIVNTPQMFPDQSQYIPQQTQPQQHEYPHDFGSNPNSVHANEQFISARVDNLVDPTRVNVAAEQVDVNQEVTYD